MIDRNAEMRSLGYSGPKGVYDTVVPSKPLTYFELLNSRRNNDITRPKQYIPVVSDVGEETVNLVIPKYKNNSSLNEFVGQLDTTLQENDSFGNISSTSFSGEDAVVSIQMTPSKFESLKGKLGQLLNVEEVEDEANSLSKRVRLVMQSPALKEPVLAMV